MWKLVSDTLPSNSTKRFGAPIATVWAQESSAPVCRLATDGEKFDLPEPEAVGNYYYLELTSRDMDVLAIPGLVRNWRREAKPETYWYSGGSIGAVSANPIAISIRAITFVPPPIDYLYQLDLSDWGEIEVTGLSSEGMKFFPAADPDNLQHPEWKFENSILFFKGEDICAPRIGGELEILLTATVDTPICRVIKFQFPNSVTSCDSIEYLGFTYKLTANRFPEPYQFWWSSPDRVAYVFLP